MQHLLIINGKKVRKASIFENKIKPLFPDTAEGQLFLAVVVQAAADYFTGLDANGKPKLHKAKTALEYLTNGCAHAEACGVSPEYIAKCFIKIRDYQP